MIQQQARGHSTSSIPTSQHQRTLCPFENYLKMESLDWPLDDKIEKCWISKPSSSLEIPSFAEPVEKPQEDTELKLKDTDFNQFNDANILEV